MDRENWEERHRSQIHGSPSGEPSDFAVITESLLDERSTVIELGCGLGADARYFAERGHSVLAVDYSRPALVHAAGASVDAAAPARFERINLNSPREAAGLLTERERAPGALQVYARSLFEALSPRTREATLRILHHLLAGPDARAFVEFESPSVDRGRRWTEYGEVDRPGFRRAAVKAGLTVSALITSPREPVHRHAAAREPGDHVVLRSELP
jgi:SAM-dependent methyltransferase